MVKLLGIAAVIAFAFFPNALSAPKDEVFSGEIMDSQCAKMGSHEIMMKKEGARDVRECVLDCEKMGGKFVLYDGATKATYQLDDQKRAEEFAGQQVKITGARDVKTGSIHMSGIQLLK